MLTVLKSKRLFLIRHGHTYDQKAETVSPGYDASLTEKGKLQAEQTARFLNAEVHFDEIFCSGMERTHDTAVPLAKLQNIKIKSLNELNELPIKIPDDSRYENIIDAYMELTQKLKTTPFSKIELAHGKNFEEIYFGYLKILNQILSTKSTYVAVFAHGGTNIIILCHLMGLPLHNFMALYQDYCAINIIDCLPPSKFLIKQLNFTCWNPVKSLSEIQWKLDTKIPPIQTL